MTTLTPVEGNPFETGEREPTRITVRPLRKEPKLTPVEGNPFEAQATDAPPPQSTLERIHGAVSDTTSGLGQGASFGFLDEAVAGGLTPIELGIGLVTGSDDGKPLGERIGGAYDRALGKVRGDVKQAQERSPVLSGVGEIAGGVLSAGGLAKQGFSLLNTVRASYPQMIGRGTAEGAGYGALHGAGTGESGADRIDRAIKEGALGGAIGGTVGAVGARLASKAASSSAPTADELRKAANLAYTEAENANVIINPASYDRMVSNAFSKLANEGVDPTLHPGVMAALKRLEELKGQPVAFKTLDILRRVANSAGRNVANKDEGRLAGHLVDELDDLMNKLGPKDVLTGDGAIAGEMIQAGRTLWSRSRKTEALENIIQRAEDKAGANHTGAGFQTALRQELKAVLRSPAALRGFSEAEVNMIRGIVRGASMENFLRHIGKFAPRGLVGTTLSGGAGYAMGGPLGAAAMLAVGEGAKRASSAITNSKMQSLIEAVRRGGPRVVQALSDKQRSLLEGAIVSGELTLDQLGLAMPSPAASGDVVAR